MPPTAYSIVDYLVFHSPIVSIARFALQCGKLNYTRSNDLIDDDDDDEVAESSLVLIMSASFSSSSLPVPPPPPPTPKCRIDAVHDVVTVICDRFGIRSRIAICRPRDRPFPPTQSRSAAIVAIAIATAHSLLMHLVTFYNSYA
jgi:hypothetical protein